MKVLVVADQKNAALGPAIKRMFEIGGIGQETEVFFQAGAEGFSRAIMEYQPDVIIICHDHLNDLCAVAETLRRRTGFVLYTSHDCRHGCPKGTVWVDKPASAQLMCDEVRRAIANRAGV